MEKRKDTRYMKGDKLIFMPEHEVKAEIIYSNLLAHKEGRVSVSIGGVSGTGKSEIAFLLRERLYKEGIACQIISLDDFYSTSWCERADYREEDPDMIGLDEMQWAKLELILALWKLKHRVTSPQINRYTDSVEELSWDGGAVEVLILEGLYANYLQTNRKYHLKGTASDTHDFRVARGKEPQDAHRAMVLDREMNAVYSLIEKADFEL